MKTLKEYIVSCSSINNENLLDESLYDNVLPIDEGIISKVANFLGNTASKVNSVWHDIKGFPKNVKLSYKGMTANLVNKDDTLPEEERTKIADRVTSKKAGAEQIKEIKNIFNEYNDNDNAKQSGFMCYLALYGKTLAENEKDNDNVKYFDSKLSEAPNKTKELAKNIFLKIKDKVIGNDSTEKTGEEEQNGEQSNETGEEQSEETIKNPEQKIDKTIDADPIKSLADTADIDSEKLNTALQNLLLDEGDIKYDVNNINNVIKGLSAIICGGILLKDETAIQKILTACGIREYKKFISSVSKVTK